MDPDRAQQKFDERQEELEEHTQRILVNEGISGLSIEKIASQSGYSRPTVYQHFASKSAAFSCVANKTLGLSHKILARAAVYEGLPRERVLANVTAFEQVARFHPDAFHVNESLGLPWAKEFVPTEVGTRYSEMVAAYFSLVAGALTDAKKRGELPEDCTEEAIQEIASHTIMFSYGAFSSIIKKRVSVHLANSTNPWASAREALHAYWDGIGWAPLSKDFDYLEAHQKFLKTALPEYWLKARQMELVREVNLSGGDEIKPAGS